MRLACCAVALAVLAGCANARKPLVSFPAGGVALPVPGECVEPVRRARILGAALFEEDSIAWWATDVARDGGVTFGPGDRGWVTTHDANGWVVHFLSGPDGAVVERATVGFAEFRPSAGKLGPRLPPRPPDPEVLHLEKVLGAAVQAPIGRCSEHYNQAIVPAARVGEEGWYVYLLAATTKTGELVVGGHVRRHVSEDAGAVLASEPMSKDCLTLPPAKAPPGGTKQVGRFVNNLVWPCPTEIHVWLSLLSGQPLFVGNRTGIWKVSGTEITLLKAEGP
jgi:hypothetical protein